MANVNNQNTLMDILNEKQEKYKGDNAIMGVSSLTFPAYIDSSRVMMDVSHQMQRVVLNDTHFPFVYTNSENMFGHNSIYNVTASSNLIVHAVIPKFRGLDIPNEKQPALIIFFNEEKQEYDLIYRQDVENLPEKCGFQYDHSRLDNITEGERIQKGETLTRPTSFDEFDNYGFGRNTNFMLRTDMYTLEDAIVVSETVAKKFTSTEVELVRVAINDNNILLNRYGDDKHYKVVPDIGEKIKDNQLCTWRIVNNSQILFDLKKTNTQETLPGDTTFYTNGEIVDIDIYCNKRREDIPDTEVNRQILKYIDMDIEFQTEIYEVTNKLIKDGKKVSMNIKIWNERARQLLDKENYRIKDENNSVFSNIVMYFLVKRTVGLSKGQKLVGRFGNKGVISNIRPDKEMPHLENGAVIDVIYDSLGVPGRLNIYQLFELSITFIMTRVVEQIQAKNSIKEKEELFFLFLKTIHKKYGDDVEKDYRTNIKTKKEKEKYFRIIEDKGIYIRMEPFWNERPVWECINDCYETLPFLHPYRIYFWQPDTARWVKQIRQEYIGFMYIMKLKQTSKKGLSVRNTGPINNYGLPAKSNDSKKFIIPHSNTPIRLGRQEMQNELITMKPETIAKEFLFQRNSPIARNILGMKLYDNYDGVYDIKVEPIMTNRNVEILYALLRQMGLRLRIEYDVLDFTDTPGIKTHIFNGKKYICSTETMKQIVATEIAKIRLTTLESGELYFGTVQNFEQVVDQLTDMIKQDVECYLYS